MLRKQITILLSLCCLFLAACTSMPDKVEPVSPFKLDRYLGTWYEIARMPHSFEEGLVNVSATYSLNDDGSVKVLNRGMDEQSKKWDEAQGKAKFVDSENVGHLKVSFFGPFYSSYVIFELDQENYQYAYISGYNTDYAWLLSRTKEVEQARIDDFIKQLDSKGFDTSKLILVEQE